MPLGCWDYGSRVVRVTGTLSLSQHGCMCSQDTAVVSLCMPVRHGDCHRVTAPGTVIMTR